MLKLILPVVAALMNPVVAYANSGEDGYQFREREFSKVRLQIHVIEFDNIDDLRKAAFGSGANSIQTDGIIAFSTYSHNDNKCTIYILKPEVGYMPEMYGHEISHCLYGQFHRENGEMNSKISNRYKKYMRK